MTGKNLLPAGSTGPSGYVDQAGERDFIDPPVNALRNLICFVEHSRVGAQSIIDDRQSRVDVLRRVVAKRYVLKPELAVSRKQLGEMETNVLQATDCGILVRAQCQDCSDLNRCAETRLHKEPNL